MSGAGARVLPVEPLTREAFAPYGEVIDTAGVEPVTINEGTSLKYPGLATVEITDGGPAAISIYQAAPRELPMPLRELERHPFGSQAFVPLKPARYLVVVAGDGDDPRPEDVRVFLATGQQGINYHPGVWHHGFLAVGETSEVLIVDRRESAGNLEVRDVGGWNLALDAWWW